MRFVDKVISIGIMIMIMLATIAGYTIVITKQLYNHFIPPTIILLLVLVVIDYKYPETETVGG